MHWLARLGIYAAPLEDTSALAQLSSPVLTRLDMPSCRRLTTLDDLKGLIGLRELDVSECGTLASLAPITGLTQLERLYLYGSTTIADGDLTPLLPMSRMHDLRMMNRRHYAPTVARVRGHLGIQQ
jgi:internalin A